MTISPDAAFSTLHKWQLELTPVILVGSLMPRHALCGSVAVVTREGVWNRTDVPPSIWGFSLKGNRTNFLASAFECFEYLQPAELPSEIRASLHLTERDRPALALTLTMKLPRVARTEGDVLAHVSETLFLVEDDAPPEPSGSPVGDPRFFP